MTPWTLQADIMNGSTRRRRTSRIAGQPHQPAQGQGLPLQPAGHRQPHRQTFLADAQKAGVPVVGVYETMPVPGYDYQSWMLAEVSALLKAP